MDRRLRRGRGECSGPCNTPNTHNVRQRSGRGPGGFTGPTGPTGPTGFTLAELLVCLAVIAILISLLFPVIRGARDQSNRLVCASNMRQITLAAIRRGADEGGGGFYIPTPENDIDTFESLYPAYLSEFTIFTCPSTDNRVQSAADLRNNAVGGRLGENGHSFEIRAWTSGGVKFPDGTSFRRTTLKNFRRFKNQSRGMLLMDADDATENDTNNWPESTDNHGADGVNVGFMDGHVEFTATGRPLLEAYLEGYYDPGLAEDIYLKHGVIHANNEFRYAY